MKEAFFTITIFLISCLNNSLNFKKKRFNFKEISIPLLSKIQDEYLKIENKKV